MTLKAVRRINGKETRTYRAWKGMKRRCKGYDLSHKRMYTDRGISYDPKWESFDVFYEDMGECPENYTLERICVNEGYCKDNCKWATITEQSRNKQNTIYVDYQGKSRLLIELCEEFSIPYDRAWKRLKRGESLDVILGESDDCYEKIEWNGIRITYSEAAAIAGLKRKTLQNRIKVQNWTVEKAMTTPLR